MVHLMKIAATGHLGKIAATGHLALPFGCDSTDWPDNPGLADSYSINGYNDGDLSACAECNADAGNIWDGSFDETASPVCRWRAPAAHTQIDGKQFVASNTIIHWFGAASCNWQMDVVCWDGSLVYIWRGTKDVGLTPAGVYTRFFGCDATANLTVV